MAETRQQQLQSILLQLLPADHSAVGNLALWEQFKAAALDAGIRATDDAFKAAREALVESGQAVKGKGRGGSTARATGPARPDFDLKAEVITPDLLATPAKTQPKKASKAKATPQDAASGAPQVLSYRHPDRRKNNPEVGLVNEASDPEQPKTVWSYDPHLDPALQFDSARAGAEKLIDDALAGDDPAAMRHALEQLRRMSAPYLQWTGKAERTSFEVDTVSLHVHERIDAMSILSAVSKRQGKKDEKAATGGFQPGLFEAPFESLPLRSAVDFYKHDRGWANRLIAGDSLLVMNSMLQKEGMAGQVQMIYIDPPYGIKYGSNFQPFTNKRDVKDRSDADLTQEPEMIKAFRDTWELGIHSYLTYLRDRLLLAKDLLSETGSVFVQISDENEHLVRNLLDELVGPQNYIATVKFRKSTATTSALLPTTSDLIVWYAKKKSEVKYRQLFWDKSSELASYNLAEDRSTGKARKLTKAEIQDWSSLKGWSIFSAQNLRSQGVRLNTTGSFEHQGVSHYSGDNHNWKTHMEGLQRLSRTNRLSTSGGLPNYKRYVEDFPVYPITDEWEDTAIAGFSGQDKVYVVQTAERVVERCMLMTTDPGDLVLDPTCGSGTTAYVAEKWGRRWITCDTSRVAVTLAKQRLMTASFDYFALRYPHEGLKGGFIYKTVPHVMLKSIANNPEIDAIYERLHPRIENALGDLNSVFILQSDRFSFKPVEGSRKGETLKLGQDKLLEWEVPFDFPADWPASAREHFDAFHSARQKMQAEMDRSIASQADNETLYDQPEKTKNKLRITGPFTVEAVPFPTVLSLEEQSAQAPQGQEADLAIARTGITSRQHSWRDELLKAGIRGKGGQMLKFAELEVLPGTTCLHASGHLDSGERVVISFGPEHGALEQRQVEHALGEAGDLFPRPKMIVFCAFAFDPEAAKDIDALKGITALKAQINTDLLTEDLKKATSKSTTNQSFWLMGQPDVQLSQTKEGLWQVEVNGFDYFDTTKGELVSGGKGKIAAWSLDTDYDGRSLFPHQFFFPMAGKDEGWMKLKKDIRAELDEDLLKHFVGTISLPFEAGANGTVVVRDDAMPNAQTLRPKLYHLYREPDVAEDLNRKAEAHEALPALVQQAYTLLGADWRETARAWREAGHLSPPVMLTVCNRTETAARVEHYFTKGHAHWPELHEPSRTFRVDSKVLEKAEIGETAAADKGYDLRLREIVAAARISDDQKEKLLSLKKEELLRELVDTVGKRDQAGQDLQNVVSVAMLSEGWDAKNVTHIMGLRAFTSQLLCEQVIGRGLRRVAYDMDENGLYLPEFVNVFGVPLSIAMHPGDGGTSPPPPKPSTQIESLSARNVYEIKWPNILRVDQVVRPQLVVEWSKVAVLKIDPTAMAIRAEIAPALGGAADWSQVRAIDLEKLPEEFRLQRLVFKAAQRAFELLQEQFKGRCLFAGVVAAHRKLTGFRQRAGPRDPEKMAHLSATRFRFCAAAQRYGARPCGVATGL